MKTIDVKRKRKTQSSEFTQVFKQSLYQCLLGAAVVLGGRTNASQLT